MLQVIELNPFVGNVIYAESWVLTADAVHLSWPADTVGTLWCYGRMWIINSGEDLDEACSTIAGWPDPPNGVM